MSGAAELWAFAVVMALGQFSPGPDMLLLTRTALAEGLKAGWLMVAGIVTGLSVHATIAIGGMAALLSRDGPLTIIVKISAALYLGWLAWGLCWKRDSSGEEEESQVQRSAYVRGLFCNLLNPKVLVFFAGVVAPFLTGERQTWWMASLWLIIVVEGLVLWSLWVWLLQQPKIKRAYQRMARALDLIFAVGLCALAVNLLWSL